MSLSVIRCASPLINDVNQSLLRTLSLGPRGERAMLDAARNATGLSKRSPYSPSFCRTYEGEANVEMSKLSKGRPQNFS